MLTMQTKGTFMTADSNPRASILAEAIRNAEEIHVAAERLAVRDHVARHYREIALPALAAATRKISEQRARLATLRQAMILPDPAG